MVPLSDPKVVLRDLGDGLIIRRATPDDTEAVAEHNAVQLSGGNEPAEWSRRETRGMMSGRHPNINASDFALVEDTNAGKIVSSLCLISHNWSYGGIEFGVGQIEFVATHPDYRGRGLVRELIDLVHGWSVERGQIVNVITGIPHYYRQFGYEYALYGRGGRSTQGSAPKLKEGDEEPFICREFQESDASFIAKVWKESSSRYCVDTIFGDDNWTYQFLRRDNFQVECRIIESTQSEPIGYFVYSGRMWGRSFVTFGFELTRGVSWPAVIPGILRYLEKAGREQAEKQSRENPEKDPITLDAIGFYGIDPDHPAYRATEQLLPIERKQRAMYVRVADVPGFVRHISPVLQERLANSIMAGHTGETKISFANGGFRMSFQEGKLVEIEPWGPTKENGWDDKGRNALFPELTFLTLLFGFRSVNELRYAFPDVQAGSEQRTLLDALFPTQPSRIQFG